MKKRSLVLLETSQNDMNGVYNLLRIREKMSEQQVTRINHRTQVSGRKPSAVEEP